MFTAFAASSSSNVAGETASQLTGLIEMIIIKVPLFIAAFILLVAFYLLARLGRTIVENKLAEKGIEEDHQEIQILGGRIAYATIMILGVTIALKVAGIDLTTIIAAVAFGIGFALRDLIMNFLSGVFILAGKHFTIGDYIEVGGTLGKVVEIQSRVTILQAINGTKVIVPNAEIFRSKVVSLTGNPFRRIEVAISVDYRSDIESAIKVCIETARNTPGILLEPKPSVLVSEWSDNNVELKVRAWVESRSGWLKIQSQLYINLKKAYDKYGIDMAYPIVQLVNDKELDHDDHVAKMLDEEKKTKLIDSETPKPETANLVTPLAVTQEVDFEEGQPLKPLNEL